MKAKEIIAELQKYDPEMEVRIQDYEVGQRDIHEIYIEDERDVRYEKTENKVIEIS